MTQAPLTNAVTKETAAAVAQSLPKRVMVIHNAYQQRGGEDAVVEHEADLLRAAGLDVSVKIISNHTINTITAKIDVIFNARGDWKMANDLVEEAKAHKADLVHIHNFWPLVTPATHIALARAGIPVVQTLHNYRLLCANGMLLRRGEVCEACVTGSSLNALRHRCYRGSVAGTAAALAMQNAAIGSDKWTRSVARFIVLTEFAKAKFADQGLPQTKIAIKGNSLADPLTDPLPGQTSSNDERAGFLFVGRIAEGKGVSLLLDAAAMVPDAKFTIVGDGPLKKELQVRAPGNVQFTGQIPRQQVFAKMAEAQWLVLPSTWFEGFPVSLVESLAHGLPAIVPRIGGLPDLIDNGAAGLVFEPGDAQSLADCLRQAAQDQGAAQQKSKAARQHYEEQFNPEKDREQLLQIYSDAMAEAHSAERT